MFYFIIFFKILRRIMFLAWCNWVPLMSQGYRVTKILALLNNFYLMMVFVRDLYPLVLQ